MCIRDRFNLQQELHKTIVFVTHDIDEALKLGDRICIMRDGQILQFDVPEVLLKSPAHGFVEEFIGKKRLLSSPELMTAEDVMIKDPVKAHPKRTLAQAVEIMRSHGVDSVLIVDVFVTHFIAANKLAVQMCIRDRSRAACATAAR